MTEAGIPPSSRAAGIPAAPSSRATRALVVDDERLNREVIVANLRVAGYETVTAVDGQDAWETLDADPHGFDVILLDRRMPRMDGMALLGKLKADERLRAIPVIMQTAYASSEDVADGIRAGVFYYLAKPLDRRLLLSVTAAAIEEHQRFLRLSDDLAKRATVLYLLDDGTFRYRTLEEATALAVALARACPRSTHLAIGLSEILTNAVEHGNLGITYEEKTRLLTDRRWRKEIDARLDAPEHRDKYVTVRFQRLPGETRITVRDEGRGFDWRSFVDLDLSRAFSTHGRGIAMARKLSFDQLEYQDPGNEVTCVIRDKTGAADGPHQLPQSSSAWSSSPPPQPPGHVSVSEMRTSNEEDNASDLHIARQMQEELLPPPHELAAMRRAYGVDISGYLETSSTLGGDLWGMAPFDDHRFALWLADFSGHGVTAALNTFRLHALIKNMPEGREQPSRYLADINQRLTGLLPTGQYATMLYGLIDLRDEIFTYAAAAAPHPLIITPGCDIQTGNGSGLPLGIRRTAAYEERRLHLPRGATLFMASDALSECPATDGSRLGNAGIAAMTARVANEHGCGLDVQTLLAPFLATVRRPLGDDLTALCCVRN